MKAFVIGSGIAGIASAIRLAVKGFEVTVFEKNSAAGGKAGTLKTEQFTFDTGPSLFTHPQYLEELFAYAGVKLSDYLLYKPQNVACNYFYGDGTFIRGYANAQKLAKELEEKLHEPATNVMHYLKQSKDLYNTVGSFFLENSLHKKNTFLNYAVLKPLLNVRSSHLFSTLHNYNKKNFRQDKTIQLFNRFATYNGSNPYKAPAILSMISHFECNEGVYYPAGGMISIIRAMQRLAEDLGVRFRLNQTVQRIIVNNGVALGIVVENENLFSDVIISNADPYYTYKFLLNDASKSNKVIKQQRSSSAIIFYWGVDRDNDDTGLHNIFFSDNYPQEFYHIFTKQLPYHDPTIYINITAKKEPGIHAPLHKENWFVMVNAPANCGQNWTVIKQQTKQHILQKLQRILKTDIEKLIISEHTADPLSLEKDTCSFMGALYGASSNNRMSAFYRHPNFSREFKGLYFAGGSVHPGGGIPLCLQSAAITCRLIERQKKNPG